MRGLISTSETGLGILPKGWQILSTDEAKSINERAIISGPFGSNISSKYFTYSGVPVIRGNNLSLEVGTRFIDKGFVFISPKKADELNTWAEKDDLIFTAVGTLGQVGILTGKELHSRYIISNKQLRLTINKSIVYPLFAYYWYASPYMQDQITQRNTGSSVPLINLGILKSLYIPVPPLPEQKAIAAVLSSLDDKIDLLHRQNATLEAMAEALFKQWFVVEAKEEWGVCPLSNHLQLSYGKGLSETKRSGYGFPVVGSSGVVGYHDKYLVNGPGIVIGRKGTLGEVIFISDNFFPIDTTYYVTPIHSFAPWYYYYFLLKRMNFGEMDSDSVIPGLNRDAAHQEMIPDAPEQDIQAFGQQVSPFFKRIKHNHSQIRTLEKLRDLLLPKLMSGEVRVEY